MMVEIDAIQPSEMQKGELLTKSEEAAPGPLFALSPHFAAFASGVSVRVI